MYSWISDSARLPALAVLITASLILSVSLSSIGASLKTDAAPLGIISFELAGSLSRAEEIMRSWDAAAREAAFLSIGLDYLFLCVYPPAISLACDVAASRVWSRQRRLRSAGKVLSRLVPVAGILDAVENYAMIQVLKLTENEVWPGLAKWCAIPKFGVVLLGLGYVAASLLFLIGSKLRRTAPSPR